MTPVYTSAPATAIGALAVSSVDNIVTPGMGVVVGDVTAVLSSEEPLGVSNTTAFPIYVASTDVDDEANLGCDPFGDDVDLDGKVAIVVRGVCAFADKALNVFNAGGSLMLSAYPPPLLQALLDAVRAVADCPASAVVNNAPGSLTADIGDVDIQSAILLQTDGAAIFAALAADPTLTATFPSTYFNFANNDTAGLVSDFTTYGLTNDGFLKPSIAAPGGNILSTWPVAKGSYTVISGTSMATPFISGVAALFISQNGAIDPLVLKAILETSSTTIPTTIGGSQLNTMAQAGSGLINAFDAVLFKTVVSPSEFSLNDTANAVTSGTITLDNTGSSATSYRISHLPAGTALTFGSVCRVFSAPSASCGQPLTPSVRPPTDRRPAQPRPGHPRRRRRDRLVRHVVHHGPGRRLGRRRRHVRRPLGPRRLAGARLLWPRPHRVVRRPPDLQHPLRRCRRVPQGRLPDARHVRPLQLLVPPPPWLLTWPQG